MADINAVVNDLSGRIAALTVENAVLRCDLADERAKNVTETVEPIAEEGK